MKQRIYYDSEFTGLRKDTTLVSIGFISEDGTKSFYAEFTDYNKEHIDDWLQTNVINNLTLIPQISKGCGGIEFWDSEPPKEYANAIEMELDDKDMSHFRCSGETPMIVNRLERWFAQFEEGLEIWSDCLAYDWVLFCDLFGAFNLPDNVYYIPFDICTSFKHKGIDPDVNREEFAFYKETPSDAQKHNSLWDAKVIRLCDIRMRMEY